MEQYRESIIEMVNNIDNENFLKFIDSLIKSFKRKWGI